MAEGLGAQVQGEDVAGRAFGPVERDGVRGGPVPVAVGRVEIEIAQAREVSEGIVGE